MTTTELKELLVNVVLFGLVGKMLWDWLKSGRAEKGIYMPVALCEQRRGECCMPVVKRDIATLETRLREAEKQLDQGRLDFDTIMKEIAQINKSLSRIQTVIEFALEIKQKNEV